MKKQILSTAIGLVMMAIGTTTYAADKTPGSGTKPTANEKVVKDFNKQFKNSLNPTINSSNDGFIVKSLVDGHEITSAYDKKGNWVYTIKLYPTDNLALNIINIVKGSFDNYFITTMEKVDQPGNESVFVVHMENYNSFKTLRVVNNEVELVEDFQKG
jgi:hypothetical protein